MAQRLFPERCTVQARPVGPTGIEVPMPCCRDRHSGRMLPTTIARGLLYPYMLVQCNSCRFVWVVRHIDGWSWHLEWPFLKDPEDGGST